MSIHSFLSNSSWYQSVSQFEIFFPTATIVLAAYSSDFRCSFRQPESEALYASSSLPRKKSSASGVLFLVITDLFSSLGGFRDKSAIKPVFFGLNPSRSVFFFADRRIPKQYYSRAYCSRAAASQLTPPAPESKNSTD
ncbi:hypothetical protein ACOSQ4_029032 [Xanthoceras sorbifolium]